MMGTLQLRTWSPPVTAEIVMIDHSIQLHLPSADPINLDLPEGKCKVQAQTGDKISRLKTLNIRQSKPVHLKTGLDNDLSLLIWGFVYLILFLITLFTGPFVAQAASGLLVAIHRTFMDKKTLYLERDR